MTDQTMDARIRASFQNQRMMQTLGIEIADLSDGAVALEMPFDEAFGQQHGFLHAGAVTSLMDSAAGYAAMSLMPAGAEVLTVEFKVNLMRPARAPRLRAEARVLKPGRTVMVCEATCFGLDLPAKPIANMSATMMVITGRSDLSSGSDQ